MSRSGLQADGKMTICSFDTPIEWYIGSLMKNCNKWQILSSQTFT